MSDFFASLLCAFRVLRKNPGFTVSALAVLALGIGANTAIFSVVNTVLLRPLPFHDSQSIVTVFHVPPAVAFPGIKTFSVSPANYLDWRKQNDVFDSMSVFAPRALRIGGGSRPQTLLATISDADFFKVLRVKPAVGRFFKQEECQPGHDAVIIVSDAFAQSHFGSADNALGKRLQLNNRSVQVIGVMPSDFYVKSWFPASTEGWIPTAWTQQVRATRGNHNWLVSLGCAKA